MRMKTFRKIFLLALIAALICCFAGCNLILSKLGIGGKFALQEDAVAIKIGEILELSLASNSPQESFTLTSSDETKVSVIEDVKIKGLAKTDGTVDVTATSESGKTDVIAVTVAYADVGELEINTSGGELIQLLSDTEDPQSVNFTAVMNEGISPGTLVSWKVTEKGGAASVDTHTGDTFVFTPPERNVLYEVSVTAGGLTKSVDCGVYNKIYISTDKVSYKSGSEITISVLFREEGAIAGDTVNFDVYQNGVEKYHALSAPYTGSGLVKKAELSLGNYTTLGTYTIVVKYGGSESNAVTVTVADYAATDHIEAAADAALLMQNGVPQTVSFTAQVSPSNADTDDVKWRVNGIEYSTGKTFSFKPQTGVYGEYHVTATSDKVTSPVKTIVYLPTADNRNSYTAEFTNYGGYPQNRYITSQEELNNAVVYALENQLFGNSDNPLNLYIDYSHTGSMTDVIDTARSAMVESGLIAGYSYTNNSDGKRISLYFSYYPDGVKIVNTPSKDAGSDSTAQSSVSKPHYTYTTNTRNFYIDSSTKTMDVYTSNMLYKAVAWGYKPVFRGTTDNVQNLTAIYQNARTVLTKICTDDMTETEKAHAIYDWIIYNVRYDYDLASLGAELNDSMKNYGYYLEGIFLDSFFNAGKSHAVCDGKSKAFVLMCGIEGINSLRIGGTAKTNGSTGGHAWNKILLDPDDDGAKNWFLIDTTWGDRAVETTSNTTEYLTHGYFLINDTTVKSTHFEDSGKNYPKADGVYDYYANTYFTYGATTYDFVINNKIGGQSQVSQLNYVFRWASSNGVKYVEFEYEGTLTDSVVSSAAMGSGASPRFTLEVRSGVYGVVLN